MRGILVTVCDATTRQPTPRHEPRALRKIRKVVKLLVEEVRRPNLGQRAQDRFDPSGMALLPVGQHLADEPALQVLLRAAQIAGNDRELPFSRVSNEVGLRDVGERPDDDMPAIVRAQLRRHRLQLAAVEKIEEEGGEYVVAVVPERDLGGTQLAGDAVERAPAQA